MRLVRSCKSSQNFGARINMRHTIYGCLDSFRSTLLFFFICSLSSVKLSGHSRSFLVLPWPPVHDPKINLPKILPWKEIYDCYYWFVRLTGVCHCLSSFLDETKCLLSSTIFWYIMQCFDVTTWHSWIFNATNSLLGHSGCLKKCLSTLSDDILIPQPKKQRTCCKALQIESHQPSLDVDHSLTRRFWKCFADNTKC